jgi:SAM-dependent methyltransferase
MMRNDVRRYAQLGWTYEKFNPLRKEEIAWHRQMARQFGGPILELACGSGRLCTALAMAGFSVDAVDQSPTMLIRSQQRIGSLTDDYRRRIRLVQADISNFEFTTSYKLIIIADNSLAELHPHDRKGCLLCARKHLEPAGRLILTARVYGENLVSDGRVVTPWSEPVTHPITGVKVRRKIELALSDDGKCLQGTMTYEITDPDGSMNFETCPVEFARFTHADYISLFEATGWRIESEESPAAAGNASASSIVRFVCSLQ